MRCQYAGYGVSPLLLKIFCHSIKKITKETASQVWSPPSKCEIWEIESVQRPMLKFILNDHDSSHTESCRSLNQLLLSYSTEVSDLILVFTYLYGLLSWLISLMKFIFLHLLMQSFKHVLSSRTFHKLNHYDIHNSCTFTSICHHTSCYHWPYYSYILLLFALLNRWQLLFNKNSVLKVIPLK